MKSGKTVTVKQFHSAALREPYELVNGLFNESSLGFGILDKQFRYRAVNRALAAMNNVSPQAHLGRPTRDVIGVTAVMLEAPFKHVFFSGRGVSFEFWAKLSKRNEASYWIVNYFPIKDAADRVKLVGGVVVEITHQKNEQQLFSGVTNELIRNLLVTPHASDALLRRMIDDSESQIPDFNHKSLGATSAGSSKQAPVSSLHKVADVLGTCSNSDESAKSGVPALTPRERDIVKFIAEGNSNKETAEILGISTKTVETHRARIRLKLDLRSTPALVCYAIRNKILDPANMAKAR